MNAMVYCITFGAALILILRGYHSKCTAGSKTDVRDSLWHSGHWSPPSGIEAPPMEMEILPMRNLKWLRTGGLQWRWRSWYGRLSVNDADVVSGNGRITDESHDSFIRSHRIRSQILMRKVSTIPSWNPRMNRFMKSGKNVGFHEENSVNMWWWWIGTTFQKSLLMKFWARYVNKSVSRKRSLASMKPDSFSRYSTYLLDEKLAEAFMLGCWKPLLLEGEPGREANSLRNSQSRGSSNLWSSDHLQKRFSIGIRFDEVQRLMDAQAAIANAQMKQAGIDMEIDTAGRSRSTGAIRPSWSACGVFANRVPVCSWMKSIKLPENFQTTCCFCFLSGKLWFTRPSR